ncbi:MAG: cytochrome c [Myxococcota bacterium]|nr:cytochrome c [Myxococcota bacterium]
MRSSSRSRWLVVALALVGCGSWRPPARVDPQYAGAIRSRDVANGRHTYRTLCAACHLGRVNPEGYHWTAAHMRHQIREGNALMPPLRPDRLSDERVEAVLAYLSTTGAIDGALPPHPDEWTSDTAWEEEATRPSARVAEPEESAPRVIEPSDETAASVVFELDAPLRSEARALGEP